MPRVIYPELSHWIQRDRDEACSLHQTSHLVSYQFRRQDLRVFHDWQKYFLPSR